MKPQTLLEKVHSLPKSPGVYIYKDETGEIIYVGKAKSLRDRVGSYFHTDILVGTKTAALVNRINDLDYIIVASDFEALILEAELIKKHKPKYNIVQKDDKSYLYIVIRNKRYALNGENLLVPLILTLRKPDLAKNDIVFGPYPNGQTAKQLTRILRKIIPFRDCGDVKYKNHIRMKKPCLYGDIGLCSAPCVNTSKQEILIYRKNINSVKSILKGKSENVIKSLRRQMNLAVKSLDYETAAKYRDILDKFGYVSQSFRSAESYILNPHLTADLADISLKSLVELVPIIKTIPHRIECYDISNISGKQAVGSMVVATDGMIDKREYRKFKIKRKSTPDDFLMIGEVLSRRLAHDNWPIVDLIVVDGGKGQVSAATDSAKKLNKNVTIIGLAKREETIVFIDENGEFVELKYPKDNDGLKLLIRLRDEAHRFAQAYHHTLRRKLIK